MDRASPFPVKAEGFGDAHTITEPLTHFPAIFPTICPAMLARPGVVTTPARSAPARLGGVDTIRVGRRALLVEVDDASLREQLSGWIPSAPAPPGDLVEIPVQYDGVDPAFVGELWGMTEDEVVAAHARP